MEAGLSPWVESPSWLRFRCWHAINLETGWLWMHQIPMGRFSRWLLCTSEVWKDKLFFLYCPMEIKKSERERCVLLRSCSPSLAWLVSRLVYAYCVLVLESERFYRRSSRCFLMFRWLAVRSGSYIKNLVLVASCPSPRQASDVKGSEVIA